jgi:hypothetical protein
MNELEWVDTREDVRPDQEVGRPRGGGVLDVHEGGRQVQLGAPPEDGDGARQRSRHRSQAHQPKQQLPRDALRRDPADPKRVGPVALHAIVLQSRDELAQQEGIAARRGVARPAELVVRVGREERADELRGRRRCEWREEHNVSAGVAGEARDEVAVGPGLRGSVGHEQQDRQLTETAGKVVQEAQRRGVGPVCVVDGQQQRSALGQIRRQPVEPMRRGKGALRRRCRDARRTQHPRGQPGGPVEQRRPNLGRCPAQRRLEQLSHDAVGEIALEIISPRAQRLHPGVERESPHRTEERGLADAGWPFEHDHLAGSRASPLDRGGRAFELRLAFEQDRCGPRRHPGPGRHGCSLVSGLPKPVRRRPKH